MQGFLTGGAKSYELVVDQEQILQRIQYAILHRLQISDIRYRQLFYLY